MLALILFSVATLASIHHAHVLTTQARLRAARVKVRRRPVVED